MVPTFFRDLLTLYAEIFGADLLRYALGAGGVFLVVNLVCAQRLARQRIRKTDPPKGQITREIRASLRTVAIFAATGTCIALCARSGLVEIYQDMSEYGLAYFWASILGLIVLHDAWFYWSHRVLHHPPIFRRWHRLHHRSHQPTPFTSYSFDPGEAVVNALYLPLVLLVLPTHPLALFLFVTHMMLRNALGHCGVEVFPARPDGKPLFGWMTTVTHHDLHHAHAGYNLGLYFTWWDRWMDTEHPNYRSAFEAVAPRITANGLRAGALLALSIGAVLAGRVQATELRGSFATPGLGAVITFQPCAAEADRVCGTLVWAWDPASLPYASVGDILAPSLTFDGTAWRGRMRDPESGWTYRGTINAVRQDRLMVKDCAGPICVRQVWHSTATLRRMLGQTR